MGQRDPLVEYQREGFDMFNAMMEAIKEEAVGFLFNVEVQTQTPATPPPAALVATGPGEAPGEVFVEHLEPQQPVADDTADDTPAEHAFDATPGAPAQALPTEPVGVAGSPVPSEAPVATEPERSVAGDAVAAATADEADPVGASLPADFGRPEQAERLEYSGPAYDAAPGQTGVTRSTGPGGTGVSTGAPQNRNDDCACGSGKKYKRCHGDPSRSR
jgi:preprotein translocase subunit SecA